MYDLVIRNGTLVDGSGREARHADVAIDGDRIVAIGSAIGPAKTILDADGHVVSPGFIDGHTHMDAQVMWDPHGMSSCWHGVTSVVMGNCGFSLAPVSRGSEHFVLRNLERAEDISAVALAAGIEWRWETFAEYLDELERRPKGINYSGYIGHSALRTWAMGERAFEGRANDDDLDAMSRQLEEALRAGAMGFTTSRSTAHLTSDDRPVPSRMASWDEVRRLVGVMGALRSGLFELAVEPAAMRAEVDAETRAEFWERLYSLSRDTGVPSTFGFFAYEPAMTGATHVLDRAMATNVPMFGQAAPREMANIISFQTMLPFDSLPEWRELRHQPLHVQEHLLADAALRQRLVEAADRGPYREGVGLEARPPEYEWIFLLEHPLPPHRSVGEVARERGIHPVELIIEEARATNLRRMFLCPFGNRDQDAVLRVVRHPMAIPTFSDSGAHVSQISDGSLPSYFLAHWVRERQEFTLEEAVRLLSAKPAVAWGFRDRGLIEEGRIADINVFDPDTVGPALPTVVWDLPGGAKRLEQRSTGFLANIVAGEVVQRNGEFTGALPGRLIRGQLADR
jgi:N-acyl-D-aspartate/D-glutamate deacylase